MPHTVFSRKAGAYRRLAAKFAYSADLYRHYTALADHLIHQHELALKRRKETHR